MPIASYVIIRPESSGNVRVFATRQEALAAVRRLLDVYGREVVAQWHLARIPGEGEWVKVAAGEDLLALAAAPGPSAA